MTDLDALRSLQEQECMCAFVDQACVRCEELTELAESHLLPIAEALEKIMAADTSALSISVVAPARTALKALQEAL